MGYTHYWYRPKAIPVAQWEKFRSDACLLTNAWNRRDNPAECVAYEYDEPGKLPVANKHQVRFNGIGEGGHETFVIERVIPKAEWNRLTEKGDGTLFAFCKTAQKPYDTLVVACLIALHHYCPYVRVSSDGDDNDWTTGRTFCQKTLGYGNEYEISATDDGSKLRLKPMQPVAAT